MAESIRLQSTLGLHKQQGKVEVTICYQIKYIDNYDIAWNRPTGTVDSKDWANFAMLFTLAGKPEGSRSRVVKGSQ
jgi:hypothetical protein